MSRVITRRMAMEFYLGTYGTVMCQVQVKVDARPHRNIWLTSIKPIPKTEARKANVNETDAPKEQEKAKSAGRWEKERTT